jgi:hypothetical protein
LETPIKTQHQDTVDGSVKLESIRRGRGFDDQLATILKCLSF